MLKGHTAQFEGIILIKSTKIRWFLRQSGGGLFLLSETKSLKTTQVVILLKSTKIRCFSCPGGRLDRLPGDRSRVVFSQAKSKGNYQAQVHSDQMVPVIVRREAGPVIWWPKTLK